MKLNRLWRGLLRLVPLLILLVSGWLAAVSAAPGDGAIDGSISAVDLPEALAAAQEGDVIHVAGGIYHGSLDIDKSITLIGHDWPVIDGGGKGTVVNISAPGASISGFVIKNSGAVLDQENSGIAVVAEAITLENNRFEDTLFGIYLKEAHGSTIRGNAITSKDLEVQRRGDPIRLWYSNDVLIEDNEVHKGRDVVLWYSERLMLRNNSVMDGRYGLHFMYCDDAKIENNRMMKNSVGAFLMYSRRVTMRSNTFASNRGPSGYGIGLKDMDDTIIVDNIIINNRVGVHLDTSPREIDSIGEFSGNVFAFNDIGVELMPSVRRNMFSSNSFIENEEQVAVAGGGTLRENSWTVNDVGNFWSDYAGFDADGDGQGDISYKSERLFENLMQQEPVLRLFLYSPASTALDFAARAFPLVKPQPKLEDERPKMTPTIPNAPSLPVADNSGLIWLAVGLLLTSVGIIALPRLSQYRYDIKL